MKLLLTAIEQSTSVDEAQNFRHFEWWKLCRRIGVYKRKGFESFWPCRVEIYNSWFHGWNSSELVDFAVKNFISQFEMSDCEIYVNAQKMKTWRSDEVLARKNKHTYLIKQIVRNTQFMLANVIENEIKNQINQKVKQKLEENEEDKLSDSTPFGITV